MVRASAQPQGGAGGLAALGRRWVSSGDIVGWPARPTAQASHFFSSAFAAPHRRPPTRRAREAAVLYYERLAFPCPSALLRRQSFLRGRFLRLRRHWRWRPPPRKRRRAPHYNSCRSEDNPTRMASVSLRALRRRLPPACWRAREPPCSTMSGWTSVSFRVFRRQSFLRGRLLRLRRHWRWRPPPRKQRRPPHYNSCRSEDNPTRMASVSFRVFRRPPSPRMLASTRGRRALL